MAIYGLLYALGLYAKVALCRGSGDKYRYFMVFKNRDFGIDGAYTMDDFIAIMRAL